MSDWQPRYILPDGTPCDPDRLWQVKGGGWTRGRPAECRNGHRLGDGQVIVGTQACPEVERGCHDTHTCRECGDVIYWPRETPECHHTAFDGRPAQ